MKLLLFFRFWIALLFGLFFLNSYYTPLLADDFGYWEMANESILKLILHLKHHYFNWGGRVLAHFLDGLMLRTQNDFLYALMNTLIFIGSFFISSQILNESVKKKEPSEVFNLSFLIFGFVIFSKNPLQTLFWRTGAANYHWMFFLLALFLFVFRNWILRGQQLDVSFKSLTGFFKLFLVFLVGATNENVGLALLGLIFWHGFHRRKNKEEPFLNKKEALVVFILIVSTLFLILAPGNAVRASIAEPDGPLSIIERIHWWIESLLVFLGRPDGLLLLFSFYILAKYQKITLNDILLQIRKKSSSQSLLILTFLLAFVFLGHNGNFYGRKGLNVSFIFTLALASLIRDIKLYKRNKEVHEETFPQSKNTLFQVGLLILFLAPPIKWSYDLKRIYEFRELNNLREIELIRQKNLGQKDLKAPIILNPYDLEDLSINSENWTNRSYARFLGINSLTGTNSDETSEKK